jgi:hypothetical protein
MFGYEGLLNKALFQQGHLNSDPSFKEKYLWVKKATGLGIRVYAQVYGLALSKK